MYAHLLNNSSLDKTVFILMDKKNPMWRLHVKHKYFFSQNAVLTMANYDA